MNNTFKTILLTLATLTIIYFAWRFIPDNTDTYSKQVCRVTTGNELCQ